MEFVHYLGRIQERSILLQQYPDADLPPLDANGDQGGPACDITAEDGIFEIAYINEGGLSLPGLARENIVEGALKWDADYIFWWDDDMVFPWSTFLRLWRHQKPVVGALAFTSRYPIEPCLYAIEDVSSPGAHGGVKYYSRKIWDFPEDKLITDEDIGGSIAFGAGIGMINVNVFKQLPRPWFSSTGCGEDWFFCLRCHEHGIRRYVDTGIDIGHKSAEVVFKNKAYYHEQREKDKELYEDRIVKQQEELEYYGR